MKAYIYWRQYDWEDAGRLEVNSYSPDIHSDNDHIFIKEIEINVDGIDFPTRDQIARAKVRSLESQRREILSESHKKLSAIDEKIRQLSALTYEPEVSA